jgi:hypothetical protein
MLEGKAITTAIVIGAFGALNASAHPPTIDRESGDTGTPARALGPEAPLFDSIDENFNPVSMADLIDGKPLVLAVSSCT